MKNNYPVVYAVLSLTRYVYGDIDIDCHMVMKCFLKEQITTYDQSGRIKNKYVVAPLYEEDRYGDWINKSSDARNLKEVLVDEVYTDLNAAYEAKKAKNTDQYFVNTPPGEERRKEVDLIEQEILKNTESIAIRPNNTCELHVEGFGWIDRLNASIYEFITTIKGRYGRFIAYHIDDINCGDNAEVLLAYDGNLVYIGEEYILESLSVLRHRDDKIFEELEIDLRDFKDVINDNYATFCYTTETLEDIINSYKTLPKVRTRERG